jgi:hypothetical protein
MAPFGVSLSGLETILGIQTRTSWRLHPSHLSLRERFGTLPTGRLGTSRKRIGVLFKSQGCLDCFGRMALKKRTK